MTFARSQIRQAKQAVHRIGFQPGAPKVMCWVQKVRGDFVWVRTACGGTERLNATASKMLMDRAYEVGQGARTVKVALWNWNENECELHSGGWAETAWPVEEIVFFDPITWTASALVPSDWTREQVDELLRARCEAYRTVMEGCEDGEDDES